MSVFNNHRPLHGVTPLYFLQMESFSRQLFVDIIRETPAELSLPFIQSILEIRDVIELRYYQENWDGLTEEELTAISDVEVIRYLITKYKDHLCQVCKDLEELRDAQSMNFVMNDSKDSLMIGKISFNQLIKEPYDSIQRIIDSTISDIAVKRDKQGNMQNLPDHIQMHEDLLTNINIAIGLLDGRINNITNSNRAKDKKALTVKFQSVANDLELVDNYFEGVVEGMRDTQLSQYINKLLSNLDTLGFNTTHPISDEAKKQTSSITAMGAKAYNQQLIPKLENVKRVLDRARIALVTSIDTLRGNNINLWYF